MKLKDLKKELISGIRENKFLVLAAGFLFFALLDPVMMKLMPSIMRSQFPDIPVDALSTMMDMTQLGCMQNYMGDIFEIGTIIVVFTLCGIISQEIKENTLVLPVCSGKSFLGIVLSKFVIFSLALFLISMIALLVDYVYAGMIMGFDIPSINPVIRVGILEGLYMVFILSSLIMFGAFVKRPIATGILALVLVYGSHFIGSLLNIMDYVPSGMLSISDALTRQAPEGLLKPVLISIAYIILFNLVAVWKLKNIELNTKY